MERNGCSSLIERWVCRSKGSSLILVNYADLAKLMKNSTKMAGTNQTVISN